MNTYGGDSSTNFNFDALGRLDFSFVAQLIYPEEGDFGVYWKGRRTPYLFMDGGEPRNSLYQNKIIVHRVTTYTIIGGYWTGYFQECYIRVSGNMLL